jgi:hypothetical protein
LFASYSGAIANLGAQATSVSHKLRTIINHVDAHHAHFCTVPHHGHHTHIHIFPALTLAVFEGINASSLAFDADLFASFHFGEYQFSRHHKLSPCFAVAAIAD